MRRLPRTALTFLLVIIIGVAGNNERASSPSRPSSSSRPRRLETSFTFSPLIGGPKLLPIHISTVIRDVNSMKEVVLDFVPLITSKRDMEENSLLLLKGKSIQGVHRLRLRPSASPTSATAPDGDGEELTRIAEAIIRDSPSAELNLYSNNCYHFAFRCARNVYKYNSENNASAQSAPSDKL